MTSKVPGTALPDDQPWSDRFSHSPLMPANVKPGQVIGLVEVVGGLGPRVDVSTLADELGADIAVLLPIIDASEMLGLVKNDRGEVVLTDSGAEFQKQVKRKVTLLKSRLMGIEPFKTAIGMAAKRREVSAAEVSDELAIEGVKLHYQKEINESLVQGLLLHWGIRSGLLAYDGRIGKFTLGR